VGVVEGEGPVLMLSSILLLLLSVVVGRLAVLLVPPNWKAPGLEGGAVEEELELPN
jgi:hypothetical protein